MTTNETFPMILNVARLAMLIADSDVSELEDYFARRDSIGPILDPTAYRREMGEAEKAKNIMRAFVVFRDAINPIWQEDAADRINAAKLAGVAKSVLGSEAPHGT